MTFSFPVFFGCSLVEADASKAIAMRRIRFLGFTLLLPEVKGHDPDEVLARELRKDAAG